MLFLSHMEMILSERAVGTQLNSTCTRSSISSRFRLAQLFALSCCALSNLNIEIVKNYFFSHGGRRRMSWELEKCLTRIKANDVVATFRFVYHWKIIYILYLHWAESSSSERAHKTGTLSNLCCYGEQEEEWRKNTYISSQKQQFNCIFSPQAELLARWCVSSIDFDAV